MCRKNDKLTFQSGVPSSATEDIKSKIVFLFGISHNSTFSQFFFEERYFVIKKIQSEIPMLVFVGWGTFFWRGVDGQKITRFQKLVWSRNGSPWELLELFHYGSP